MPAAHSTHLPALSTPQMSGQPLTLPPDQPSLEQPFHWRLQWRMIAANPVQDPAMVALGQAVQRQQEAMWHSLSSTAITYALAPRIMLACEC